MKLSAKNRAILIRHINKTLEVNAKSMANESLLENSRIKPFGDHEIAAMEAMKGNSQGFTSLLERLFWQNGYDHLFDLFCIIDGVSDPEDDDWTGVLLIDKPKSFDEHVEFLHDLL
jgi:hypothetical protein